MFANMGQHWINEHFLNVVTNVPVEDNVNHRDHTCGKKKNTQKSKIHKTGMDLGCLENFTGNGVFFMDFPCLPMAFYRNQREAEFFFFPRIFPFFTQNEIHPWQKKRT